VTITSRPIVIIPSTSTPGSYTATLTSYVSVPGGYYSWTRDNPGMVGFVTPDTGTNASQITLGIISTNDKTNITLTYTPPCGTPVSDSFAFALTNDTTEVAWIDASTIDTLLANQNVDPASSVFNLTSPGSCVLTLNNWAAAGRLGYGRTSNGLADPEVILANDLIFKGASNPRPSYPSIDTDLFSSVSTAYKLYQRFQAYYEIVNGQISSFRTLHAQAILGVTEDPCFGLVNFAAETAFDNATTGISQAKDYVYQINEGRKAKLGQYTDQFLNGIDTTASVAQDGPATPYIWSVIQFDVNGKTRALRSGTVYDNVSVFPTFWTYSGSSFLFAQPQGSVQSLTSLGSSYQFLKQ